MPGTVNLVEVGKDATETLFAVLERARQLDPLAPVTVTTPTVRSAVHLRQAASTSPSARGGDRQPRGIANVHFSSFAHVVELCAASRLAASPRHRLGRVELVAAIAAELSRRPGRFAPVLTHPSTTEEIASFYEDLRYCEPAALAELARAGRYEQELVELCGRVAVMLAPLAYDDVDEAEAAARAVSEPGGPDLGEVVVHLPQRLRPVERRFVTALARTHRVTVLVALSGTDDLDAPARALIGELVADGFSKSASATKLDGEARPSRRSKEHLEVLFAGDPELEVTSGVRLVLDQMATGVAPERLGLVFSRAEPYAPLVAEVLGRAGVPWSGSSPGGLEASAVVRFLDRLLVLCESAFAGQEDTPGTSRTTPALFGRAEVLALGYDTPLRDERGQLVVSGEWDRCSRLSGIVRADVSSWSAHLGALEASVRRRLVEDEAALQGAEAGRGRAGATIAACRGLSLFVAGLDRLVTELVGTTSWADMAVLLRRALESYLGDDEVRARWPEAAAEAAETILSEIDRLVFLDGLAGPASVRDLHRYVGLFASQARRRVGRLGSGLVVGAFEQVVGLDLDLVVLLGCSEDELVGTRRPSMLVGGSHYELLGLSDKTDEGRRLAERLRFELACAAASKVVVTFSSGEIGRRAERVLSPLVRDNGVRVRAPSAPGMLERLGRGELVALSRDELERAALFCHRSLGGQGPVHHLAASARLSRRLAVAAALSSRRFGPHAGHVGLSGLAEPLSSTALSPTRLEQYATCPFRYYLEHLLSLEVLEDPEQRLSIDPRDRGSLVHDVLEAYVTELIAREKGSEAPRSGQGEPGTAERLEEIAYEFFSSYERLGKTGKAVLWELEKRNLLRRLLRAREIDEERRLVEGLRPVAVEHRFGFDETDPVEVVASGRRLFFRGYIDRVDRAADGSVRVIDYKTGSTVPYLGLRSDPVDRGRHLQLPIYALAAKAAFAGEAGEVHSAYRFIDDDSSEMAFVLGEETMGRFLSVLDVLVEGIDTGVYPYRPGPIDNGVHENCRFCDFREVCPADRGLFWEAARTEASVASYARLSEEEPESCEGPTRGLDAP